MSRVALLDVNVLVALFEPEHVHHEVAHEWFADSRRSGWATCPLTENGLVRILTSPGSHSPPLSIAEAVDALRRFRASGHHEWWDANLSFTDTRVFRATALRGHRQVSDVYLAGLAHARGGKLATFDRGIPITSIVGARPGLLEVIALGENRPPS